MGRPLSELKSILLDLLFLKNVKSLSATNDLDTSDWKTMREMLQEHRLGPLMHWRLTRECPEVSVPQSLRDFCAKSFKKSTMRSMTLQRELRHLHQAIEPSGFKYVALKGAWLAFHAYPQPALRPLRDLDILVPERNIFDVYQALIDAGCRRVYPNKGCIESVAKHARHLPPLWSVLGGVTIEPHLRLTTPHPGNEPVSDLANEEMTWTHIVYDEVAGVKIPYLSPADQLFHLIDHAVYEHKFTNGPLTISDLGYLLQSRTVDWTYFWSLTQKAERIRGSVLALKMLEHFWGKQDIIWPENLTVEHEKLPDMISNACQLILRDVDSRSVRYGHNLIGRKSFLKKITYLLSLIFPSKSIISARYPIAERSVLLYAFYPVYWALFLRRGFEFLRDKQRNVYQAETAILTDLEVWLR